MNPEPLAPPVVAAVVTCDPGWWLEGCLESLAAQDYPNFSVLVIDAGSTEDPTPRVAAVLPTAYVRRVPSRAGFAAAANEVLGVVEGASHLLFCHDDVALAPDALRLLVEEAFRSNAGIVTPKLVRWNDPERLLAVGASIDKGGASVALVERDELDQEQHDTVRDVFSAPAGCLLVRADLFGTLRGFDTSLGLVSEDLDLSWRAHVAGARVVVAPGAVVRHLEATRQGLRALAGGAPAPAPLAAATPPLTAAPTPAHLRLRRWRSARSPGQEAWLNRQAEVGQLRAVLKNYGVAHLARILPQLLLVTVTESLAALLVGNLRRARSVWVPWRETLLGWSELHELRAARAEVHRIRAVPDREVRSLQAHGHTRLSRLVRGAAARPGHRGDETVDLARAWREGLGLSVATSIVLIVVLLYGTRRVLVGHLPAVGQLLPLVSAGSLFHVAWSGWRFTGMGSASPATPAFALLGLAAVLVGGHTGFLLHLLVLGTIPAGVIGAFRLTRPFGSRRARLTAAVLYAANPLPFNALAHGHWDGLISYAIAPWVLLALATSMRLAPFGETAHPRTRTQQVLGLGVLLAVNAAFVPFLLPVTIGIALLLVVGSLAVGRASSEPGASVRAMTTALGGVVLAAVLLIPWIVGLLPPWGEWAMFTRASAGAAQAISLGSLLRFQTGPVGATVLGWTLLITAALPLLVGGGWRGGWATRLWVIALGAWAIAWAGARGWLGFPLPSPEVVLAPGLAALAASAGLGVVAFETDVRGHRFGWRQMVSMAAAGAAVLAVLPVLGSAQNGRWYLPGHGLTEALSFMPGRTAGGEYRVLWIGEPDVLPLGTWRFADGLAYGTSRNGFPDVSDLWPGSSRGVTRAIGQDLRLATHGETTQLGALLAPMAVRYVVVVQRSAPSTESGEPAAVSGALLGGLQSQVDLRHLDVDPSVTVYENATWVPLHAALRTPVDVTGTAPETAARTAGFGGAAPVLLQGHGRDRLEPGDVFDSEAPSARWNLTVGGVSAARHAALGVANEFTVSSAGPATLRYATPPWRILVSLAQVLAWVAAVALLWRERRRGRARRREAPGPGATSELMSFGEITVPALETEAEG